MNDNSLKVLFACSELTPWVKTGGLADVCGSLPQALADVGEDVRIVLPGYQSLLQHIPAPTFICIVALPLGNITLCRGNLNGIQVLLVMHESFTNRPGNPYMSDSDRPWADNAFRFALFSQAVGEIAQNRTNQDWQPDIVHCHDWQTGLVPALLSQSDSTPNTSRPATVFTIHNLAYQGNIMIDAYNKLGLPSELLVQDGLEFWNQASFIKGGIAFADKITTVSPTYADEITSKEFGCGMEGLLQHRRDRLSGILNGIDTNIWDPETDPHINTNYTFESIDNKINNKKDLQTQLKLREDPDALVLGVISRLAVQKGIDVIIDAMKQLKKENIQFAMLAAGDSELQQQLQTLAKANPENVSVAIGYDESLAHRIEAGADVFLMPSRYEPCGLNQMYSHRYGTLPLVTSVGGLADTVIDIGDDPAKANGFVIPSANSTLLHDEIMKVIELFKDKTTWRRLQHNAMQIDYSWTASADQYKKLYRQTVQGLPKQKIQLQKNLQ